MPFYLPPMSPEYANCVQVAAQKYQVPDCILIAIHQVESSGATGTVVHRNSNGTDDYGATQINDVWANYFNRNFGITTAELASNTCLAIHAAGYVVRYEINRVGNFWEGIGDYHSRTPAKRDAYERQVAAQAERFGCSISQQ